MNDGKTHNAIADRKAYIYGMKTIGTLLVFLFLFSCQKETTSISSKPVPAKKKDLTDFGIRYCATGDFNGDGITDTIKESYISELTNKETHKVRNVENPSLNRELIAMAKPKSLLNIKGITSYDVTAENDQSGIYDLENIGDINNDGGDEFGFRIKWESQPIDLYKDNSFIVHTLQNGNVKELYTIGGLSIGKAVIADVKRRIHYIHSFEKFFAKIKDDTIYQREKVKYPLSIVWVGFQESDTTIYVKKNEYNNLGFDKPGVIIRLYSPDKETIIVKYQLEDTGVNIDYYYKEDEESWYLDHVVDSSM